MKVKDLANKLNNIKKELQNKEVYIVYRNGLLVEPSIKFALKDNLIDKTKENVDFIILGYIN